MVFRCIGWYWVLLGSGGYWVLLGIIGWYLVVLVGIG